VTLGGTEILVLPWICADNEQETIELMHRTSAQVLFGHLEIKGFEMYRGAVMDHGVDGSMFSKFELVASGHFHHPSKKGNIQYLGAPYEMTWSDYDDPRGFHIFDTQTREMEFVRNPLRMFHRLSYDDAHAESIAEALSHRPNSLTGKIVKVVVKSKTDPSLFDQAMTSIEAEKPAGVQIVDDHLNKHLVEDLEIASEVSDTLTILKEYVSKHARVSDRKALDTLLTELYNTALEVQWAE
jgi:DNA repair exonuclease SbcCD nuclease subunit